MGVAGRLLPLITLLAVVPPLGASDNPRSDTLSIRGRPQSLRLYGSRGGLTAIVASGDGGWIHLGPYAAELLARHGYFVVGFDSKAYLAGFTSGSTTLSTTDVPGDLKAVVEYASGPLGNHPVLVGVSEGAALAVLAATDPALKSRIAGVIGLGLPQKAELGWRFRDSVIYLTKGVPNEPLFDTAEVVERVSPLPLVAIHSTNDEFVPLAEVRRVMSRARPPAQLWTIEARNHRFSGNERDLEAKLLEAIEWLKTARP